MPGQAQKDVFETCGTKRGAEPGGGQCVSQGNRIGRVETDRVGNRLKAQAGVPAQLIDCRGCESLSAE